MTWKTRAGRRWSLVFSLLALVSVLALPACGGDDDDDGDEAAQTQTEAGEKVALEKKTIGIMGPVDAAEIIKLANDATERAAEALGWEVVRVDPGGDPAKMASGMTSLVNRNVDAIVLTTMEPATIASR